MRRTLLAAILATAAFAPVAAAAQDAVFAGDRRSADYNPDVAEQLARRADDAPRAQRSEEARPAPAQQQAQQQAQWQGNRGGRGDRPQFQPRPEAQTQPQAQSQQGSRPDWGNRGNNGGGWNRGDRGGFRQGVQSTPAQPAPAPQAQNDDRGGRGYNGNRGYGGNRGYDGSRGFDGNRPQPGQRFDGNRDQYRRDGNRQWNDPRAWNSDRGGTSGRGWDSNRGWTGDRGRNGNGRGTGRRPDYNRNWRSNNRYNWQSYRSSHRQAFRLPRYYAPYGWNYGYRTFSIGAYLDDALFDRSYWIDSPYDYRLPEVEWPYRWVRYYNDALLVDTESGEVVDVIRDIFW